MEKASPIITDEKLRNLPAEPWSAVKHLAGEGIDFLNSAVRMTVPNELLEVAAFILEYMEQYNLKFPSELYHEVADLSGPAVAMKFFQDVHSIASIEIKQIDAILIRRIAKERLAKVLHHVQGYEVTDEEVERIQHAINELRLLIASSHCLSEDYKTRLLRRLEAMQQEIHKHTSDFDRFFAFLGELGIAARKFGEDLKPITERASELTSLVFAIVARTDQVKDLPAMITLLLP